jgi:hypothetical protein
VQFIRSINRLLIQRAMPRAANLEAYLIEARLVERSNQLKKASHELDALERPSTVKCAQHNHDRDDRQSLEGEQVDGSRRR